MEIEGLVFGSEVSTEIFDRTGFVEGRRVEVKNA